MFVRSDINEDTKTDLADVIFVLAYLFQGGESPLCLDAADVNDNGRVDLSDPIFLLGYLFQGGSPPTSPFPEAGLDPTADTLDCF